MLEQLEIRLVRELNKGQWYISYTALAPCRCRLYRDKLTIYKKTKPTTKQIQDAIIRDKGKE